MERSTSKKGISGALVSSHSQDVARSSPLRVHCSVLGIYLSQSKVGNPWMLKPGRSAIRPLTSVIISVWAISLMYGISFLFSKSPILLRKYVRSAKVSWLIGMNGSHDIRSLCDRSLKATLCANLPLQIPLSRFEFPTAPLPLPTIPSSPDLEFPSHILERVPSPPGPEDDSDDDSNDLQE